MYINVYQCMPSFLYCTYVLYIYVSHYVCHTYMYVCTYVCNALHCIVNCIVMFGNAHVCACICI